MIRTLSAIVSIVLLTTLGNAAAASNSCSIKDVAGKWMFATGVGRQMLGEPFPAEKDITAIGTMNIERDGSMSGVFDVTIEDFAFFTGNHYSGTVVVNPDCTGTVVFTTDVGTTRSDSIVVVSRNEVLAMSQDPMNLWTYQMRRIAEKLGRDRRDDD